MLLMERRRQRAGSVNRGDAGLGLLGKRPRPVPVEKGRGGCGGRVAPGPRDRTRESRRFIDFIRQYHFSNSA